MERGTIITGKMGTGKTKVLLSKLNPKSDNLVITNDPAVLYIELYMARNHIPGRCVGINSIGSVLAKDLGLNTIKEASREVEMAVLGDIIKNTDTKVYKAEDVSSGLIDKLYSFLTECDEDRKSVV